MTLRALALLAFPVAASCAARGSEAPDRPSPVPLFNGRDLSGWVVVNGAPDTWTAREGLLVCSGKPTGMLRTAETYEDFVLELEWRHLKPGGNSGVFVWADALPAPGQPFVRGIEVQVLDGAETADYTSHGDVFSVLGARLTPDRPHPSGWERCLPSERRAKPAPEWNRYRITCRGGAVKLEVNGKEVSGGRDARPRKGAICLESEGSEVHFRDLTILELAPASAPLAAEMEAEEERGFRSLYTGTDLSGWREDPAKAGHWVARDWVLDYDGQGDTLWSEQELGDFELIADWRWSGAAVERPVSVVLPSGEHERDEHGAERKVMVPDAGDSGIYLRGDSKSQVNIWCWPVGSGEVWGYRTDPSMPPEVRAAVTPRERADAPIGEWNRFHITMKGERLTVVLNGRTVIQEARLPGVNARGRIALQHHGHPIQFANLFVREI